MSTPPPVLDRVSALFRRISMGAEAAHLRLTRGVTLTKRVEAESGDPEDWSFLRRPALLGLLAVVSICVGALLPSSPFKQEMGGTWFFGEADWPTTTLMLPGVVAVYGGISSSFVSGTGASRSSGPVPACRSVHWPTCSFSESCPSSSWRRFSARTCSPTPPRARS